MGVYIKGMEMPKSCYACMFFAQTDYWNKEDEADILSHCKRTGEKTWESVNGYLPNCPLVSVPKHGRLIDADKIGLTNFEIILCQKGNPFKNALEMLFEKIENAPTILEAEEGEA